MVTWPSLTLILLRSFYKDPCDYRGLSQTIQDNLSTSRSLTYTFRAPFATEGNIHRFWELGCGYPLGAMIQPITGHLRNSKLPGQGERNPSSAGPQGHVRIEEGLDPKGVIGGGEEMVA